MNFLKGGAIKFLVAIGTTIVNAIGTTIINDSSFAVAIPWDSQE